MAEKPEPPGESPLPPAPRRHPATAAPERAERGGGSSRMEQLASLVDTVKVLANQLSDDTATEEENPRERSGRRKKFQRSGVLDDHRAEAPATAPSEPPDAADLSAASAVEPVPRINAAPKKNLALPEEAEDDMPAPVVRNRPRPRARRQRRSTMIPLIVMMACNLFVLAVGYWLGQSGGSSATAENGGGVAAGPSSAAGLEAIDTALRAERRGEAADARRQYNVAVEKRIGMVGAEYRLALLAIGRSDLLDADLHLVHSVAAGECVGPCCYVRATFAGSKGNYAEAGREMEAASHAEPFNGKYFFYWGECLRRQGKPQAAIDRLAQALTRAYNPEDGNLYLFKLGLAKIEANSDANFAADLASHLQQPNVGGDWWLLAAANDLGRAAYPAAADHLKKAAAAMPAALFDSRVLDFFFQAYKRQAEVAAYFNHAPTPAVVAEAGPSVMDPGVWTPDRADPGSWPVAAPSKR